MTFNEDKMKNAVHSYLEFPGVNYDEDNYNFVDEHSLTSNFDTLILIYGVVCAEFMRQGMMDVKEI